LSGSRRSSGPPGSDRPSPGVLRLLLFLSVLLAFSSPITAKAGRPLTLCVHPYLPASEIQKRFTPLASYLGRELGVPVYLHIAKNYDDHIRMIGENEMGLAFTGPVSYVRLVVSFGPQQLLGRLETNGKPEFSGVVFVADKSPVHGLSDLVGKRFAFGDIESTMSHIVPRHMLWKAGVTVDMLSRHSFLNSHDNVVLGVLMGDFDAGAVMDEVFLRYRNKGLRAIAKTPSISEHVFVAGKGLPPAVTKRFRKVLTAMKNSPEGREALRSIKDSVTGVVPVSDSDYDNLRVILNDLKRIGVAP